jgi:glucose 1-dehydrogenase
MKFDGKVAVVTGAAQGIGRACAERLLQDGAKVVLSDVKADELAATAAELGGRDAGVHYVQGDVAKRSDVEKAVSAAVEVFGRLDIMVNNAGIAKQQDFLSITDEDYDEVMNINLKGAFFGVQTAARQMIAQGGGGVIVNVSSVNANLAIPTVATYAMSKGGMKQLITTSAVALAPHDIRVVGVGPGTILTDMVRKGFMADDEARRKILSRTPIGRCGEPSEIGSVVSFLASDDASYITGQTIYADGGRMILNYTVPVEE